MRPDDEVLDAITRVTGLERRSSVTARHEWTGTTRYEVLRLLGEGGMGGVYEVFDRETQRVVALKTLLKADPASVYRFKQEFRTLADVQHPNLVHLYEFVATESGEVFFTMELVRGTNFVTYAREHGDIANHERLRAALRQLVEGVLALHAAGKLHRDIKPSNVLVTPEGRVVLLDFGVAAELSRVPGDAPGLREVVGTVSYMAPEQARSDTLAPACDWYSVGVVLYVALVGALPFAGSHAKILEQKVSVDPVPPSLRAGAVPSDLDSLCMALLARAPSDRPTGAEILRRLGAAANGSPSVTHAPAGTGAVALVGREAHLLALGNALEATGEGRVVAVFVAGLSGMGKSALLRQFLDEQASGSNALVLRGRAYERESVPFKAIDAVVDALSLHLVHRARESGPVQLSEDAGVAAKIFPVLGRVRGIEKQPDEIPLEPTRVRRRAFIALRDLLASAAAGRRLVIYIDDVQWGDADSAALLLELLRPEHALPLLLVLSYRQNEVEGSDFLRELRVRMPERVDLRELDVGPLSLEDAERLAHRLFGADARAHTVARTVARESGGSPFLVEELVSSLSTAAREQTTGPVDLSDVTLEQMVSERARRLPEDARRLLDVIAIEGRPVPVSIAAAAAEVADRTDEVVAVLRTNRFVRGGLRDGREVVEMSHDRIRETVAARLSPETTRVYHAQLARVLEALPDPNPELVAVHLLGAGEKERGAKYAEAAAERAAEMLAFDRAALLFRTVVANVPASSPDGRRSRLRLAQVLEWAGRGAEAGRVYEDAARAAPAVERTALERAAAEQLLTSGRIDEGAAVLHRVLSDVNLRAPRTAVSALLWLLVYRAWLRVHGLDFRARSADELAERQRLRLDALFTAALGFGTVDVVLSACMTARYLVSALRAGEHAAIQRAASLQMSLVAASGGVEGAHERALEQLARRLVEAAPDPESTAFFRSNIGISHYCRGRWMDAVEELDAAIQIFPANRAGRTSNVHVFCICSLVYAGKLRELRRRLPRLIAEAEDRGDLFMLAHMRASHPVVAWLAADDPDDARRHVRGGMAGWPRLRFVIQDWQAMLAEAQIELYAGDGAAAYERVARDRAALRKSLLLQAQIIRGLTDFVHGRAAVASIESAPAMRTRRLAEAAKLARRLAREGLPWTTLLSSMLDAAIANARDDEVAAAASLRASLEHAKRADMTMHGAAVAHQLGSLIGGEEGAQWIAESGAAMAAEDIRAPARWAAMLLPGRWSREMCAPKGA